MQVADLAAACERLGHPIAVQVLHNLETGRRTTVPVTDLLALARALDVPAVLLIAPVQPPPTDTRDKVLTGYPLDVEALPDRVVPGHIAVREVTGEHLPDDLSSDAADRWLRAAEALDLYRVHKDLTVDLLADGTHIDERGPLSREDRAAVVFELGQVRERMAGRGLVLPDLDPGLADELSRTRLPVRRYLPSVHEAVRGAGTYPEEIR